MIDRVHTYTCLETINLRQGARTVVDVAIPAEILDAVDQYLELYTVYKQLEARLKELRTYIEPFMRENSLEHIGNRNRTGRVQLTLAERPSATARYSTYDLAEILALLEPSAAEKCVVNVVDKDKLEALAKLGEVPTEVLEHRITKPTYSLSVRFIGE